MLSDDTRRRLSLARWYAQESIVHETTGDIDTAHEDLQSGAEYLSTVLGRKIVAETPSDIIALCCAVEEGSAQPVC